MVLISVSGQTNPLNQSNCDENIKLNIISKSSNNELYDVMFYFIYNTIIIVVTCELQMMTSIFYLVPDSVLTTLTYTLMVASSSTAHISSDNV